MNITSAFKAHKKLLLIVGVGLLLLVILYFSLPSPVFFKILNFTSMGLMGIMVIMLFRTYNQEKPVKKFSLIVAMITPLATLFFQLALLKRGGIYWTLAVLALVSGVTFGRTWSKSTILFLKEQKVFGRNTVWWMAFWGISFILVYAMNAWGKSNGINIAIVVMAFTTGKAVGMSTGILHKMKLLLAGDIASGIPYQEVPADQLFCENCGTAMTIGDSFCENCGFAISGQRMKEQPESKTRPQAEYGFCENCGSKVSDQDAFCEECGERVA